MSQTALAGGLSDTSTFAGVLAALTEPAAKPETPRAEAAPTWLNELEDDVSLLSYERALKAHGRYRAGGDADVRVALPAGAYGWAEDASAEEAGATPDREAKRSPGSRLRTPAEDLRKRASVTVRMSRAECERLQQRSAEAGLTVSAYLRSCAFEVDSLRAQVKQALGELRAAKRPAARAPHWWLRIFRVGGKGQAA